MKFELLTDWYASISHNWDRAYIQLLKLKNVIQLITMALDDIDSVIYFVMSKHIFPRKAKKPGLMCNQLQILVVKGQAIWVYMDQI